MNVGTSDGITVNSVGTLSVENCFISGFPNSGVRMLSAGRLVVKGTDIKRCGIGIEVANSAGTARVSIDHCHLDENALGFVAQTTSPGTSTTTATDTTANNNNSDAWICGNGSTGKDVLNLESCSGSENISDGLVAASANALSVARYSNCVFANNAGVGVVRSSGIVESRGNNTITGNGGGATVGTIGTFSPM